MSRIEQVNSLLQQELAGMIVQYVPLRGGLITVTGVNCSPDLHDAIVYVSVLPEKFAGTVLRQLRQKSGLFASHLRTRIKMKRLPSFRWELDTTESKAADLEEVFHQLQ